MKKAILATKIGMTQTEENDGYESVQVGFSDMKNRITVMDKGGKKEVVHRHGAGKALQGHFEKAGTTSKKYVREFRFENASEYELGQEIKADIFEEGDKVDVTAITKGHMGSVQVTVRNLEIVRVDAEKNLILIKGAVPGPKKGMVTIKETTKVDA